jgi:hypothetical protein
MEHDANANDAETLWKDLGLKPEFVAEEGPPVDVERLRQYIRRELGPPARQEVSAYVTHFRRWYEALVALIRSRDY